MGENCDFFHWIKRPSPKRPKVLIWLPSNQMLEEARGTSGLHCAKSFSDACFAKDPYPVFENRNNLANPSFWGPKSWIEYIPLNQGVPLVDICQETCPLVPQRLGGFDQRGTNNDAGWIWPTTCRFQLCKTATLWCIHVVYKLGFRGWWCCFTGWLTAIDTKNMSVWNGLKPPTTVRYILSLIMDFMAVAVWVGISLSHNEWGPVAGLSPALLLECFGAALPLAQHSRPCGNAPCGWRWLMVEEGWLHRSQEIHNAMSFQML